MCLTVCCCFTLIQTVSQYAATSHWFTVCYCFKVCLTICCWFTAYYSFKVCFKEVALHDCMRLLHSMLLLYTNSYCFTLLQSAFYSMLMLYSMLLVHTALQHDAVSHWFTVCYCFKVYITVYLLLHSMLLALQYASGWYCLTVWCCFNLITMLQLHSVHYSICCILTVSFTVCCSFTLVHSKLLPHSMLLLYNMLLLQSILQSAASRFFTVCYWFILPYSMKLLHADS